MATSVVFIVGLSPTEKDYASLIAYIEKFYKARLPVGTPLHVTRWDKDVVGEINEKFPNENLVIVGFSFGGQKAVEVCSALAKPIKKLILIDPVDYHNGGKPNTVGFTVPDNVASAACFYREAKKIPWSSYITKGGTEWFNKKYVPVSKNEAEGHGEYVWKPETMTLIKSAL